MVPQCHPLGEDQGHNDPQLVRPRGVEMLGVEGIAALLEQPRLLLETDRMKSVAEQLARSLIAGVDAAAAGGVMRDDVCLLVGVVK